jgi:cytochrome b561
MLLHWTMAVLILLLFGLGRYMVELPDGSPERSRFFALHKSVGLTVALLALVRIVWRATHPAPPLPGSIRSWQRRLAEGTHYLLYALMIVQPLSGYLSSSFSGYKTRFWGIPLPHWGWQDAGINEFFTEIHVASSVALLCLVILHVCGAFAHLAGAHESVLPRMLPAARAGRERGSP